MKKHNHPKTLSQPFRARILGAILLAGLWGATQAQEQKRPPLRVPEVVNAPAEFAPSGWHMEKETLKEADLNGDGRLDAAMVISSGEQLNTDAQGERAFAKHVLILALRGSDGKLHRSIVSDAAVLDGDEGGVFGDPFESLSIERSTVVIKHYSGSRDRWSYTHRYRYQNGEWTLIGLTIGNSDTLDPEHFDDQDINLLTGLVNAREKGESEPPAGRRSRKPLIAGSYYELEVPPVEQAPIVDGQITSGEWPGRPLRLNEKRQAYRNAQLWNGLDDVSAQLRAVRRGDALFLCAEVTDNEVTSGDAVRLVTKKGQAIKPLEGKISPSSKGYVFEARYSLKEIVKLAKQGNEYAEQELDSAINPTDEFGDVTGFQLEVSVEVVDVDDSQVPKQRSVLSTRIAGSPYGGAIRIFRQGTLVLVSDSGQ